MVYARVHDQTVADDYYAAMDIIEGQLEQEPVFGSLCQNGNGGNELLALIEALEARTVEEEQQALVEEIRQGLLALAA